MSTKISASEAIYEAPKKPAENKKTKEDNNNIAIGKRTKAASATETKIKTAQYQIEELKCILNNPSTKPKEKAEIKKQIEKLKNIYKNTKVDIQADGSVRFTLNSSVNVEDFKEAFKLTEGSLRNHLNKVHDEKGFNKEIELVHEDAEYYEGRIGAYIEYDDGYRSTNVKRFWGGVGQQADYTRMRLDGDTSFTLSTDCFR